MTRIGYDRLVKTTGAVPFRPLVEGACVGATVVMLADMSTSGVSVGVLTLRGPNADVIERMTGVSVTGEWVLWTLTAECADTVSDPSEESLLSNAPGVNRKEVREGARDRGWYSGC
jgi:hypothetical protein